MMEEANSIQSTNYTTHHNNQAPLQIHFSNRLQTSPAITSLSSSLGTNLGSSIGRSPTLNDKKRSAHNPNRRFSTSSGPLRNVTDIPLPPENPLRDVLNTTLDAPLLSSITRSNQVSSGLIHQSPLDSDSLGFIERGEARRAREFPRKISIDVLQHHYQPASRKNSSTNLESNAQNPNSNGYSYSRDYFPPSANSQFSSPGLFPSESNSPTSPYSKLSARDWSVFQVSQWLKDVNLESLVDSFQKNDVNGEVLLELNHSLLKQMGINTVGPRVRCLQAIKSLSRATLIEFRNDAISKERSQTRPVAVNGLGSNLPSHITRSLKSSISSPSLRQDSSSSISSSGSSTRNGILLGEAQPSFCPLTPASAHPFNPSPSQLSTFSPRSPTNKPAISPTNMANASSKSNVPIERDIMSLSAVQRYCVKVVGEGGQSRVVDLKNALESPQAILGKVLAKFSLPGPITDYAIFVGSGELTRMLSEDELMAICSSPSHPNKEKFILRKKYSPQALASNPRLQNIGKRWERPGPIARGWDPLPFKESDIQPVVAGVEVVVCDPDKANRVNRQSKLFARRPDSKKIASNLSQYFPAQKLYPNLNRTSLPQNPPLPSTSRNSEPLIPPAQKDISVLEPVSESNCEENAEIIISNADENDDEIAREKIITGPIRKSSLRSSIKPLDSLDRSTLAPSSPHLLSPLSSPTLPSSCNETLPASPSRSRISMDMEGWIQGALIGAGSFGNVFLGLLPINEQVFAVKQVELPEVANRSENRQKADQVGALQSEIALMRELSHPNIVQYLGSSSTDQHLNIFLEYVPGGSVAARLAERGAFSEDRARHYVKQILDGLEYLHRHNIIHRDIKGGNVLVDDNDNAKIADFGVSKKVQDSVLSVITPHRVSLQGSVYWMAPEVVKQTHYTRKADIWSLGCLVIEMLTGDHPFPSFTQMQAIFKIGTYSAPELPASCSSLTRDFLTATLNPKHAQRPSSADLLTHPFVSNVPKPPVSPGLPFIDSESSLIEIL